MSLKRTDEKKVVFQNEHAVVVIKNDGVEVVKAVRTPDSFDGHGERDVQFNTLQQLEEFAKNILEVTAAAFKELAKS